MNAPERERRIEAITEWARRRAATGDATWWTTLPLEGEGVGSSVEVAEAVAELGRRGALEIEFHVTCGNGHNLGTWSWHPDEPPRIGECRECSALDPAPREDDEYMILFRPTPRWKEALAGVEPLANPRRPRWSSSTSEARALAMA